MKNVPFIDLPPEGFWGMKYEISLRRFTDVGSVFHQTKGGILDSNNVIGVEAEWESIRFRAYLLFSCFLKRLYKCTLVIPYNNTKWDATEFITTFNVLVSKLGNPAIAKNMTIKQLRDHKNYQALSPEELPYFEWHADHCVLKHRFIDHWGNGAETTMEPM